MNIINHITNKFEEQQFKDFMFYTNYMLEKLNFDPIF